MASIVRLLAPLAALSSMASPLSAAAPDSSAWYIPPIHVVDEAGKPLPQSEVSMYQKDNIRVAFQTRKANASGEIAFTKEDYFWPRAVRVPAGDYEILVLARGRAPVLTSWTLPTSSPLTVRMPDAGEKIEIILKSETGAPIPQDLIPAFYPPEFALSVWPKYGDAANSVWPEPLGGGRYQIAVEETTAPWRIMVQHPGFLRGYDEAFETTSALKKKTVEYRLPIPGTVGAEVTVPEKFKAAADKADFMFSLSKFVRLGEIRFGSSTAVTTGITTKNGLKHTFSHIAPGDYYVSVVEGDESTIFDPNSGPKFRGGENVTVRSGETTSTKEEYKAFDPAILKGGGVAEISVLKLDGSPAANMPVRLKYLARDFGEYYTITSGTLTDKGTTIITGLLTDEKTSRDYRLVDGKPDYGNLIGRVNFQAGETSRSFNFSLAPNEGDLAPDITLHDVNTSESVKLSDMRGKVVYLDFWATWCGPCQTPMAHLQEMLTEHRERWSGRVAILGASIDDDAETVVSHVKEKGWDQARFLWCGSDGFMAKQPVTYGVDSIPTAFLIDQQGKVIWRGHSKGKELVKYIDGLLATASNGVSGSPPP